MDSYSHGLLFKYLTVLEKRKNKIPNLQINLNKVYKAKLDFPTPTGVKYDNRGSHAAEAVAGDAPNGRGV